MMKLSHLSLAAVLCASSFGVLAQTKAPEPDYTLSYHVGVVTDYRYRGLSQSSLKPAIQGSADFAHKSGFYLGVWGSSIDWIKDDGVTATANSGSTSVEVDLHGGYKGSAGGLSYDVGLLQYVYPGNKYANIAGAANANTTEIYGAISVGPVTAKYSHSLSNTFGFDNSKGSYYVDLSANFDLGNGFSLVPHAGYQSIKNNKAASYSDYSIALNKDFGNGLSCSLSLIDTDTKAYVTSQNKDKGKSALSVGLKYSF